MISLIIIWQRLRRNVINVCTHNKQQQIKMALASHTIFDVGKYVCRSVLRCLLFVCFQY